MVTSIFVQTAAQGGREERAVVFGAAPTTRILPALPPREGGFVYRVRQGLGFVLRQLARAIYVSPVLIVAKLVVRAFDERASDLLLVAFAVVVVVFFVVLNLYILWSLAWWLLSRRQKSKPPRLEPFDARTVEEPGRVRVVGRVERLGERGDGVVLRDVWEGGAQPWRLTEVAVFLVRPDDASQPAVVVACTTAPEIRRRGLVRPARGLLAAMTPEATALAPSAVPGADDGGVGLTLAEGDRVEVTAVLAEPFDNLERIPLPGGELVVGDPEGAPYRDQPEAARRDGLLFLDDAKSPLFLRVVL
jgi:hypothetical protein